MAGDSKALQFSFAIQALLAADIRCRFLCDCNQPLAVIRI
jgi:hypothetical protein